MNDRFMFLADEIAIAFVDDFMALPIATELFFGDHIVVEGKPDAVERHDALFYLTH